MMSVFCAAMRPHSPHGPGLPGKGEGSGTSRPLEADAGVALPGTARDVKGTESRYSVTLNLSGQVLPGPPPHPQGAKDEGAEEHDDADEQQE